MSQNCFVFPLLASELSEQRSFEHDILKEGNPNRLLYQICIRTTDYLELVINSIAITLKFNHYLTRA